MLLDELDQLFGWIADHAADHARGSAFYRFLDPVVRHAVAEAKPVFERAAPVALAELGPIILPYRRMGAIDSLDLFGLDELMMFAFYHRNRGRYRHALDIGANLGLHSIILAKCGFQVDAYEPDPDHYRYLTENLAANQVAAACRTHQAAVSDQDGEMTFVRVLGNTTSSHLAGAKANPYGALERFPVTVCNVARIPETVDLAKIDAEGHEVVILTAIPVARWQTLDAFVEIGTPQNAAVIHDHFSGSGVQIFAQKTGWRPIREVSDLPTSYREGGVFLSAREKMPW